MERRKTAGRAKRKEASGCSELGGGSAEGAGRRKRRERARKANREDILHAKEHMLGERAKRQEGGGLHRRNALGRTGQDGPRVNEDEISDEGCRMDGQTRGKRVREFLCSFRWKRLSATRFDTSFGY